MGAAEIRRKLLRWYARRRRDLPWRRDRDPYRVWIAEVMLQQTRVAAVIPYYSKFLNLFPTVADLARARPQKVLRAWAGLGYYARARNLHGAARRISAAGHFPSSYKEWLALPGVGKYTAAAISSITLGEARAVVDGNVRRVVSRVFAASDGYEGAAEELLDRRRPGDFNQAMMELGATICLPRAPLCTQCPLAANCRARREGRVAEFPAARRRKAPQRVSLRLAVVRRDGRLLLVPPTGAGFWPRFWTLPQLPHPLIKEGRRLGDFRHAVTFRDFRVEVFEARLASGDGAEGRPHGVAPTCPDGMRWVSPAQLSRLPLSTPSRKALSRL
jgi:A/G-specific adenine glycosylase